MFPDINYENLSVAWALRSEKFMHSRDGDAHVVEFCPFKSGSPHAKTYSLVGYGETREAACYNLLNGIAQAFNEASIEHVGINISMHDPYRLKGD